MKLLRGAHARARRAASFLSRRPAPASKPDKRPAAASRKRRAFDSPLARQLMAFNVIAIIVPVVGVLYLGEYGHGFAEERRTALRQRAEVIASSLAQATPSQVSDSIVPLAPLMREADRMAARGLLYGARLFLYSAPGADRGESPAALAKAYASPALDGGPGFHEDSLSPWQVRVLDFFLGEHPPSLGDVEFLAEGPPLEAMEAISGFSSSRLHRGGDGFLIAVAATPVFVRTDSDVVLVLVEDAASIDDFMLSQFNNVAVICFAALFASLLISAVMFARFVAPIRRLAGFSEQLRSGGEAPPPPFASRDRHDELGELAEALAAMSVTVRERVQAAENFTADLAHEVKNPLASLRNATELLAASEEPAERDRLGRRVQSDVRRLNALMEEILASSRLQSDLLQGGKERIALAELVREVAGFLQPVGPGEGGARPPHLEINLDEALAGDGGAIEASPYRLAEALRNLVINALSFSPQGGVVEVSLSRAAPAWLAERLAEDPLDAGGEPRDPARLKGYWVGVQDRGPGIAPGREARVFERFYTERSEARGRGGHFGLGLDSVRQVAAAHGGFALVRNRPGGGAGFFLFLPAAASEG